MAEPPVASIGSRRMTSRFLMSLRAACGNIPPARSVSMIAVKADVAHLGGRDKREDALHHAEAGAQNRHKRQFPPGDNARDGFAHGRLDLRLFQ